MKPPPSLRNTRARKAWVFVFVVGIALALITVAGLWLRSSSWNRFEKPTSIPAEKRTGPTDLDALTTAFIALEERERQIFESAFGDEIRAEPWADAITDRWDALNRGESPHEVWALASDGVLTFSDEEDALIFEKLPLGIRSVGGQLTQQNWSADELFRKLKTWQEAGWKLHRSEWRLSGIQWPANSQSPVTRVDWKCFIQRDTPFARVQMTGLADIQWTSGASPLPRHVEVRSWQIFHREGPLPMEESQPMEIPVPKHTPFTDPIVATDMNGDGLPEWVWVGAGHWLGRSESGEFEWVSLDEWPKDRTWAAAVADIDNDGRDELLMVGRDGLRIVRKEIGGPLKGPGELVWRAPSPLLHPQVLTVGDMDGDGWLDVYLGQYKLPYQGGQFPTPYYDANDGFPSYLLKNLGGGGRWADVTNDAGLMEKRHRRAYSASFLDVNIDGSLDLVVVSDFAGIDVFLNDGQGKFRDVTESFGNTRHSFGMAHAIGDFASDALEAAAAFPSILMTGMDSAVVRRLDGLGLDRSGFENYKVKREPMTWGNRLYRGKPEGVAWVDRPGIARTGWSWGVVGVDLLQRGRTDFFIANGHETRASTRDYEREFWTQDVYVGQSARDPLMDAYFRRQAGRRVARQASYGGWYNQAFLWDAGEGGYVDLGWMFGLSWPADGRQVLADDLNGDGRMDLMLTTQEEWPMSRQRLVVWMNRAETSGNWIGFEFPEGTGSRSPLSARVEIATPMGLRAGWVVSGDSFRTQHPARVHFGLRQGADILGVRVYWADGGETDLGVLEVRRWHRIARVGGGKGNDE